jgi:hypothetical protein
MICLVHRGSVQSLREKLKEAIEEEKKVKRAKLLEDQKIKFRKAWNDQEDFEKIYNPMQKNYILRLTLPEAVDGHWNGGQKKTFDFQIEGIPRKDSKGYYIRVGSWDGNFWANVTCSKTVKKTLSNIRRRFAYTKGGKWEYIETDPDWRFNEYLKVIK